jgi:uncharacterized linocin/CFP29 family protein
MSIEKILVGDDHIDFAKAAFPYIPNASVEFVSSPDEMVRKAKTGQYTTIVTDLEYTENGREGYVVLEQIKDLSARKVLWTGRANEKEVQEKGRALGAEVLDKDEIGSLVGQVVNKAKLKENGLVLIYVSSKPEAVYKSLEKVMENLIPDVVVSSDLKRELQTGKYGLVIDTTTMMSFLEDKKSRINGAVAHDIKYLQLNEVPRVVCVSNATTIVADIVRIVSDYKNMIREKEQR